jgi:L-amino acid N-acyltransferase YncA
VRDIFAQDIETGYATFEASVPTWEEWDKAYLPFCRLVARTEGHVVGWAALTPTSQREAYAGVAEASLYIADEYKRQGVGLALQTALISESEAHGIWTLQAVVFADNAASLALLNRTGFREVGRRERIAKLNGVWRDTILLERRSSVVG